MHFQLKTLVVFFQCIISVVVAGPGHSYLKFRETAPRDLANSNNIPTADVASRQPSN